MLIDSHPKRTNGFICPWNLPQFIVWISYIVNLTAYFGLELPSLTQSSGEYDYVILALVFVFLLSLVLYYGYRATVIDSEDSVIAE